MEYMVRTEGLEKRYDDFSLGPVSIEVPTGAVVGLVGANGAGKTTFIKALLGLVDPDAGRIGFFGTTVAQPLELPTAIKEQLGVVFDTCAFTQESSVADVARLGRAAYSTWDQQRFDALIDAFEIDEKKRVRELSRGMGMKLTLAFALAHAPQLLILDEATAGLDPLARDEVLDILRDVMADGQHSILMCTHITSDLEKLADEVICIDDGKVVFDLPKDVICDETGIVHCREAQLEEIRDAHGSSVLRILRGAYGIDVLVPDRFAFARRFPSIPAQSASIDEYVTFMLKGDVL